MARRKPKGNNYERIGQWLIDYWLTDGYQSWLAGGMIGDPPTPPLDSLKTLMNWDMGDQFFFHYDREQEINISIPLGQEVLELQAVNDPKAASSSYKRDLGYVILGGCRR